MERFLCLAMLLGLYISSDAGQGPAGQGLGRVIDTVACKADATQTYALYVPRKGNAKAMPVVIFFDPHGSGSLPLNKYRGLAETYGFILVGSNNSKNGNDWSVTENIWNRLFADIRQRLTIDDRRLYLAGFSGGAKVASYVAIQHPGIRAIVAGGAGLPDGVSAADFPFSFTILAGEGDMNLTDLVRLNADLGQTRTRHRVIIFDGRHDWAPAGVMDRVFAGWQLEAIHDGVLPRDPAFIERVVEADKAGAEGSIRGSRLIRAAQDCRVATSYLEGLTEDVAWFRQKSAMLEGDPRYKRQTQERETLFAREESMKTEYMRQFQQGDNAYWRRAIADLQAKALRETPEKGMYQRLLAYLSLAFYSISNQLINANRNDPARHFVELYKMADPANSEAWYFSAVLDAREGRIPVAGTDLQRAVSCGFRDKVRLRRQIEFQKSFSAEDFGRIEKMMSK
jgi:pimeloyl-ACP methyl ester carboxylesterase